MKKCQSKTEPTVMLMISVFTLVLYADMAFNNLGDNQCSDY